MSEQPESASRAHPALQVLATALGEIRLEAGLPSLRRIASASAEAAGGSGERPPSHTSVGTVLRCASRPRWRYLELIVRGLGKLRDRDGSALAADVERFHALWKAAAEPVAVRPRSGPAEPEETLSGGFQSPFRPDELDRNCVLPLALDDQWMPRGLLRRMAAEGALPADVEPDRQRLVRWEFVRSLLTAKQVVINRAFLFRNDEIAHSYTRDPASRTAFAELLREDAVLIFLMDERDPLECGFAKDPGARDSARSWAEIARSVQVGCVRLAWDDDDENRRLVGELHRDFERRIRLTAAIDRERLLADLGRPGGDPDRLRSQLSGLARRTLPRKPVSISRSRLYAEFVVRQTRDIEHRRYDFGKPNMIALKWLFDLVYNSNLAIRLGVALAGPADSVHRSAVHSPHFFSDDPGEPRLDVARVRSAVMETILDALFRRDYSAEALSVFAGVTLSQVVEIRASETWRSYIGAVDGLLAEPWLLAHPERGLRQVLQRYDELIDVIGGRSCG